MKKGLTLVALSITALLSSATAMAETDKTGFYVGGNIGSANLTVNQFDESAVSVGAYGGYNFTENFGLEGTLFTTGDLGDYGDIRAASFTAAPKFSYYFNDSISMFAKVGLTATAVAADEDGVNNDFSGIGWVWGLGLNAAVTDKLNVRVSYEMINADLEHNHFNEEIDSELSNISLGVHYQF
ncbi:porin family protein [Shewanella colwelliana]|uniref:Outer membrane protein beta-barrel domain-containing protein n=1 Tax=Shewanella colwelliana TaxID=23 RepID=A0A1E5IVT6_SHECO|nr:porin family protein [Shewanella colwelliana]MDX1283183.1 porin family protein [Shewanella colwelliana]OEG74660.1 hypothetical protein BEL05_19730 [Shewanella colwelliana]